MISKKILLVFMLIGTLAFTASCSSSKDEKDVKAKDDYLIKLSDSDIEGEHIKLDLSKKVTVDADITPISKYRDGDSSYNTKNVGGDKKITYKKYKKTPTVFNYPVKDLIKIIEDNSGGKFSEDKIAVKNDYDDYFSCEADYHDKKNNKGSLLCYVSSHKMNKIISEQVYFMSCDADWDKNGETSDSVSKISIGSDFLRNKTGLDEPDLSFGTKSEIGEKMSRLMKDITKSDNYGDYQCVVVNEKNFPDAFKDEIYKDLEIKPLDAECYVYFFPYKIDGFEWKSSEGMKFFTSLRETEGLEYADDVAYSDMELYPLNAVQQVLACNADGISELDLGQSVIVSSVYKEKQEVLPLNDAVNILQEYFNGNGAGLFNTNVYSIKLCYTGMFSDPKDGALRNIAKPCWCAEYIQERNKMYRDYGSVFIDASTGKIYE